MREIAPLRDVLWTPPQKTSHLLTRVGVPHGFGGRREGMPGEAHHLRQVHGTRLHAAPSPQTAPAPPSPQSRAEGDGLWTRSPGTIIAVKTADCLPVLLVDRQRRLALAVHAGWRGLTQGILAQAVAEASQQGIDPSALLAVIGPAISRERYEVGDEVVAALSQATLGLMPAQAALCLAKGRGDRWQADLSLAAVLTLLNHGLPGPQIEVVQACTHGHDDWYSYRREGKGVGSNWSWIALG